ncbi:hypothetical protein [Pedobacter suwonensis]|uniref:hypothetical protein n=1 Tax=Pedobacter suwonensis TaxID=332999 RepID=UPI0011A078C1|nr:hypothetical protein [Pedobacter suwonensis]
MIWPDFSTMVAFTGSEQLFQLALQEKLYKPLKESGFPTTLLAIEKNSIIPTDGFIYFPSWINLYLTQDFIVDECNTTSEFYLDFTTKLEDIFKMTGRKEDRPTSESIRAATYTIFYKANDGKILLFQMHNDASEVLISKFRQAIGFISDILNSRTPEVVDAMNKSYSYTDVVYYVGYLDASWRIIDPLLYVSDQINSEYRQHADLRAHKPDIILQEDNLNRRHTFGDNWVLEFDGLSTYLDRPNDVGLYSSICEKNLIAAKKFYDDTILIRHQHYTGNFPIPEQQREYFDYFELITTALIFAYSSIEAFINNFIPDDYTFTKPNGTKVMDKNHIERFLSLTDKLKNIFTDIYNTPNPEQETWWQSLTDLQELRDQTIHTKQHYSQIRYSKLLSREIFRTIQVYKVIIGYYGKYMQEKDKNLINEFPYNFGFDQVYPALMTDRTYEDIYNSLHNPYNPL